MSKTSKLFIGIMLLVVIVLVIYFSARKSATSDMQNPITPVIISTPSSPSQTMNYTQATITTNMGSFTISLDPQIAPNTVANFIKLASSGFYDKVKFHRIIAGFMIQGGDPLSKDDAQKSAWGTGGPGYSFNDEITPDSKNVIGAVAMANAGPNTNGSQFFVNVANNDYLDGHYSVFGHVTSGMDVVMAISKVPTDPASNRPLSPVVMESIQLK